jgi:hypothetical protein
VRGLPALGCLICGGSSRKDNRQQLLKSRFVSLASANPDYVGYWRHEYLAITYRAFFATSSSTDDRLDDLLFVGFRDNGSDQRLWKRSASSRGSATPREYFDSLLLATSVHVLNVESTTANRIERTDNDIYPVRTDNCFYFDLTLLIAGHTLGNNNRSSFTGVTPAKDDSESWLVGPVCNISALAVQRDVETQIFISGIRTQSKSRNDVENLEDYECQYP